MQPSGLLAEILFVIWSWSMDVKQAKTLVSNRYHNDHYLARRSILRFPWHGFESTLSEGHAQIHINPENLGITLYLQGSWATNTLRVTLGA
ncbi:hypothetical protein AFLA_007490 [Aspergillus flavus NRRL3357]|nr:hypothetical protein AFLA_007490 [Aspergillus flavus NRRL3357]